MQTLKKKIAGLGPLTRSLLAIGLGLLSGTALPPHNLVIVLIPVFTLLVWQLDGLKTAPSASRFAPFVLGWCFGFGQFLIGLYWISNALLVDAEQFGWAVPLVGFLMPAGLALFSGLGVAVAAAFWCAGPARVLLLALAWTLGEWLRGHVLTGFPWNLVGYAWSGSDAMMQGSALFGVYGLSLLTVAMAAAPATLGDAGSSGKWRPWAPVACALLTLSLLAMGGALRLAAAGNETVPGVRLRIVQAGIDQQLKWRRELRAANLEKHLSLSLEPGGDAIPIIIWPEAAVPYYLPNDPAARSHIAQRLGPGKTLLTGTLRAERQATAPRRAWNSLVVLDDKGDITTVYDKSHLVPFGEYLPMRALLAPLGLEKLTEGLGDFSGGPGLQTLSVEGLPAFSPLICYEVIFPGAVASGSARPQWLLNVTNDAWFGNSAGPRQHFAMARFRAVEEGLPLVRAANTGISAIVDSYGRQVAYLEFGESGILDGDLPRAPVRRTIYARFGDVSALMLAAVMLLLFLRKKRAKRA